jgi:hypothetical protein
MKLKDIINEKKNFEVDIAVSVAKRLDKLKMGLKAYQKVTTDKGWKKGIDQILAQIEKTQDVADKEGSKRGVLPY